MARSFCVVFVLAALGCWTVNAIAQSYPSKPIRIVVPYSAGSNSDTVARMVAVRLSSRLGQQIIVENKPGAGGVIGLKFVADSAPDGYTVALAVFSGNAVSMAFARQRGVDLARDFEPVSTIATIPTVLVVPSSSRFRSLREMVEFGQKNPRKLTYGSLGADNVSFLAAQDFGRLARIDLVGIRYEATQGSVQALMSGHSDLMFSPLSAVFADLRGGKLKALAVVDAKRSSLLPEVPAMPEAGVPSFYSSSQYVIFAPAKTPPEIAVKLGGAIQETVREQSIRESFASIGAEPLTISSEVLREDFGSSRVIIARDIINGGLKSEKKAESKETAKPEAPPIPIAQGPIWNALAEKRGELYRQVDQLHADRPYTIRIDLAALAYTKDQPGIVIKKPGQVFRDVLRELVDKTKSDTEVLTAVILTDAAVFTDSEVTTRPFSLRLDRVRRYLRGELTPQSEPLEQLQKSGDADFVFAPLSFDVQTRETLPKTVGSVAVSIWYNGKPIDEISVDFCTVESECTGARLGQYGLYGIDSARTALAGKTELPAAALHLLSLGSTVVGVFRDNMTAASSTQGFVSWKLEKTPEVLSRQIDNITLTLGKTPVHGLPVEGYALFGAIFPPTPQSSANAAASFTSFFKRAFSAETPGAAANALTVFVRAQFPGKTPPTLIPLGMASVRLSDNEFQFLGRHFRVETPLRIQSYGGAAACIRDWEIVGPPPGDAEPAFTNARSALKLRLKNEKGRRMIEIGGRQFPITDRMEDFFAWVTNGAVTQPTVLSILSHHDRDHVRFDNNYSVPATTVRRSFTQQPTVAILNGCSTGAGEAGATGFIAALNTLGVQAVIASITEVSGQMAGDFLDCLAQQVETAPAEGKSLSDAFAGALSCLDSEKGHGAKAYWYTLLGDGGLRLCRP